jgi:hypothetical protein
MALKENLKLGQHVSFLRMSNKAVSLTGTIADISEDQPIVAVKLDGHDPEVLEIAHVDDVTALDQTTVSTATNAAAPSGALTSFVTVNDKPL